MFSVICVLSFENVLLMSLSRLLIELFVFYFSFLSSCVFLILIYVKIQAINFFLSLYMLSLHLNISFPKQKLSSLMKFPLLVVGIISCETESCSESLSCSHLGVALLFSF